MIIKRYNIKLTNTNISKVIKRYEKANYMIIYSNIDYHILVKYQDNISYEYKIKVVYK